MNRKELENRLIQFAVLTAEIISEMPDTKVANHLSNQLVKSGTSPALNYGEAQGAESHKDFIHKMSVALKELRESNICLEIIKRTKSYESETLLKSAISESNELISIFYRSIQTATIRVRTR
ncbi:MAG: four helix bundle protein [Balneolaceae bacterium]|nr:MAG: four helix bundle protein [Balneolaceae bacterium]